MKAAREFLVVASIAVCGACGGGEIPSETEGLVDGSVPPAPSGWSVADGPTVFDEESLFEYLDGGAPLYLDYGFERLTQVRYQMGSDPFASVTLDIYDMGSELGAFGVYRTVRPPGAEAESWGVEGFRSGTIAAAWRGAFYVYGEADDDRPVLIETLESLVASAIDGVGGPRALPIEIGALPADGRVPWSERYVATDLFGHAFLPGGFVAGYEVDGDEVELFFTEFDSASDAEEAITRWRLYEQEQGDVQGEVADLGDGGFRFSDPGLGSGMVVRSENFIAGSRGSVDADEYVRELLEVLTPR